MSDMWTRAPCVSGAVQALFTAPLRLKVKTEIAHGGKQLLGEVLGTVSQLGTQCYPCVLLQFCDPF